MKHLLLPPDFDAWRVAAREALRSGFRPEELDLGDASAPRPLALSGEEQEVATGPRIHAPRSPRAFVDIAKKVAAHRDPERWNLLYRLLFRLQSEPLLLQSEADPDVVKLLHLQAQVQRDLQEMEDFVQFHKILEPNDPSERPLVVDEAVSIRLQAHGDAHAHHLVLETPTPFGPLRAEIQPCPPPAPDCEHFVAWFAPAFQIVPLVAPRLAERYRILRWTVLTPDAVASWDPAANQMRFGPGVARETEGAPDPTELEALWRVHFPALIAAPEVDKGGSEDAKDASEAAAAQAHSSFTSPKTGRPMSPPTPQFLTAEPFLPEERSLRSLAAALSACTGCDLCCNATQAVPGAGSDKAALMLIGEQPGDREDREGKPFVGPAGAVLDGLLEELGIPRASLYMTNAVKHFKFVQRGKLRLHQSPRMSEITACRPWLLAEIAALRPRVILCLGASASKSLLGSAFALMQHHGQEMQSPHADHVFATIHPSAVLRGRDAAHRSHLRQFLVDDLALAWRATLG